MMAQTKSRERPQSVPLAVVSNVSSDSGALHSGHRPSGQVAKKRLPVSEKKPASARSATRELQNRVAVLSPDNVDVVALEATASNESLEFRRLLLQNALTVAQAREQLGIASAQTVHNWVKQKRILALPDRHRLMLPKWQFDSRTADGVVDGLSLVLRTLDGNPFGIAYWLTARNSHLGNEAPISLLRRGRTREVVEEARGIGLAQ